MHKEIPSQEARAMSNFTLNPGVLEGTRIAEAMERLNDSSLPETVEYLQEHGMPSVTFTRVGDLSFLTDLQNGQEGQENTLEYHSNNRRLVLHFRKEEDGQVHLASLENRKLSS